jgi:hypothetical protein
MSGPLLLLILVVTAALLLSSRIRSGGSNQSQGDRD